MTIYISSTKTLEKHRIYGFDYLRVICAICVVAIHSFDTNPLLYSFVNYLGFAVPVFLMMSFFLFFKKIYFGTKQINFYLKQRYQRLLPCFFLWTIIYLFVRIIAQSDLSWSWDSIVAYLFFGRAAVQLYYLPLTIYYCILLLPLIILCRKQKVYYSILAFSLLISSALAIKNFYFASDYKDYLNDDIEVFFNYAVSYSVYAILGIYFAYLRLKTAKQQIIEVKTIPLFLLVAVSMQAFFNDGNINQYLQIWSSIIIFAIFYYLPFPQNKIIATLSKVSLGIYLSHHLFIEVLQKIEQAIGYNINNISLTMINFIVATLVSILFSLSLHKIAKLKFMVS